MCFLTFFVSNENFAAMSKYSLDSLESIEEDSLEKSILMNNNNDNDNDKGNDNNLEAIKSTDKFVKDILCHLSSILTTSHGIKGTKHVKLVLQNRIRERMNLRIAV